MEIVTYNPELREAFIRLSRGWIERYFALEPEDIEMLEHIDEALKAGAEVFFALESGEVIGTGMIQPLGQGRWEICKLATEPKAQGRGVGTAIFQACMNYALSHGAARLLIVSNRILKPALHIYEKFGFREIPVDGTHHYARGDIQLEYIPGQPAG